MLLARSINPSAPAMFHAPLSPRARAYKPPKGGASKFHIPFFLKNNALIVNNDPLPLHQIKKK